jgi:potassium/chloride transporter 9
LITFANDLKKSGLYVLGHVKVGNINDFESDPILEEYPLWLKLLDKLKVKAFVEVTMSHSVRDGLHQLARIAGLGAMKPNTILMGFYDDEPPIDFFDQDETYGALKNVQLKGDVFLSLRGLDDSRSLSREEYVSMVFDCVFRLQKSVCIARHFHLLNKNLLVASKEPSFIDIWPINFFAPQSMTTIDNCWLFLMQLACILHMVPGWKSSTSVRVFMCVDAKIKEASGLHRQWEQMLQMLRIEAVIHVVIWDHITSPLDQSLTDSPPELDPEVFASSSDSSAPPPPPPADESTNEDLKGRPRSFRPDENYLRNVNTMIQEHSHNTAVVFLYLPPPPAVAGDGHQYLESLSTLTENLPPTLLVHGISPVTSTTL